MKKILYTLLAATTLFAVACNKEAEKNVSGDETVEASFSVGLAGSQTKAAISDGTTATQLVVGVYDRAAGFIEALSYLPTSADHKKAFDKELTAKFDARLVKGHAYDIVFLAVAPDNGIYTIDLAQKTFTASTVGTANAEVRDAFYGVYSIEKVRDAIVDQPVNLTRPFAQFNAISTKKDYEYAKSALVNFAKSAMTITAPTVMNLLDGTVGTPEKYTLSAAAMPVAQPNFDPYKTAGDYWLMFNYILAGKEKDTANLEVSLFDDKETELVTYALPTVPIQRNYRITVYGSLLTTEGSFKVMLQPGFDGSAEFTLEHPKVTFENTALEEGKPVKVSLDAKEVNFKATHPVAGVKPTYTSSNEKVGVFDAQKEGILQLKGNGTTTVTISFPAVVDGKPVTADEGTKADAQNETAGLNYAAFEMKFEVIVGEESVEPGTGGTDVLNLAFTGIEGTGYAEWTGKKGASGAVYAGQSGGDKESIQLRSNNNNSGIVSTTSGGTLKKVTVTWNDETAADRELSVYGSNTAYTAATDLYGDNAGTLIGTIKKGTSTELAVTDSYKYVGLRSKSGAMYLTEIKITWEAGGETPSGPVTATITAGNVSVAVGATKNIGATTNSTATITYQSANTEIATVTDAGVVTGVAKGSTKITLSVAAVEGKFTAATKEITVTVSDGTESGTEANPYTVAEALAVIDGLADGAKTEEDVYVKGKITTTPDINLSFGNATFDISDAGSSDKLNVFRCFYLNGAKFTSADQVAVGDEVVVKGKLQKYVKDATVTPEVATGGEIVTHTPANPDAPKFGASIDNTSDVAATGGTKTITVTGNVAWTATQTGGATVAPASGTGAGSITVTIPANTGTSAKEYTVKVTTTADVTTKEYSFTIKQDAPAAAGTAVATMDQTALAAAADKGATVTVDSVISFTNSSDYSSATVTELRVYKGKNWVVSAASGHTIKKIEIECTANGTTKQGPGCWGAGAPSGYTFETDGPKGVWEGSATSVTFSAADNQVRIKSLKVTYTN